MEYSVGSDGRDPASEPLLAVPLLLAAAVPLPNPVAPSVVSGGWDGWDGGVPVGRRWDGVRTPHHTSPSR